MINNFEKFNEQKMNEEFLSKIKDMIFPSDDVIINKIREKVSDLNFLIKSANQDGDIDSFLEFVDNCEFILNKINLLSKHLSTSYNTSNKIEESEYVEDFIKYALNAIYDSWPESFSFTSSPLWFEMQVNKVLKLHNKFSEKYGTSSMQVKKKIRF